MEALIRRWQRAAQRVDEERVRILEIDGRYRATSSSHPLGSYALHRGTEGWECECVANAMYGLPCKHLSALADALKLDVLSDMHVLWDFERDRPLVASSMPSADVPDISLTMRMDPGAAELLIA